jgi:enterochelin esterase family protein
MKPLAAFAIAAAMVGTAFLAIAQSGAQQPPAPAAPKQPPAPSGPDPNSQYRLGPDSMPQPGVPQGEIRGPLHWHAMYIRARSTPIGCTCPHSTIRRSRPA